MIKQFALLRGINVGGHRKILMADLKVLFEHLGFSEVRTYIQSGNVVFNSESSMKDLDLADDIQQAIFDKYEFKVPVLVRSIKELKKSIKNNPYYQHDQEDIKPLHLTFLKEKPSKENLQITTSHHFPPDEFTIKGKDVFILCNGKYHQTKLSNNFFEKKLKVSATTRNWKTVLKILELSE